MGGTLFPDLILYEFDGETVTIDSYLTGNSDAVAGHLVTTLALSPDGEVLSGDFTLEDTARCTGCA